MILIFTNENDLSTLEVAKRLYFYNKEFYIINPEENTLNFSYLNSDGIFFYHNILKREINLLNVSACWWRRTGLGMRNFVDTNCSLENEYLSNQDLNEILYGKQGVMLSEFKALRTYIYSKVYSNSKINLGHPSLMGLNRLQTLDLAKKHGLQVPYFEVIANTRYFNNSNLNDQLVTKAIENGLYHTINGTSYYTYTELHDKIDFTNTTINIFPSLAMNLIDKKFEIRTFYIDGHFYSMAIFSQSNEQTKIDFRKYNSIKPNRNEPFQLPLEIEKKLDSLFKEIGLNTGSIDLILDKNDQYVFLEINPIGQYGMTSEPCNYNLDDIIAKYLIYGTINQKS